MDVSEPGKTDSEIEERVRCQLRVGNNRRVDLELDALFDATLFKLADAKYLLVFWIHHLLFDPYALSLIFQEFWTVYAGLLGKVPGELSKAMQYSEYCTWQAEIYRRWIEEREPYWSGRLAGATGIQWPDVSIDPISAPGVTEVASCVADPALTSKLRKKAERRRIQLSTYALTAYALAVRQLCRQTDFVLATTVLGHGAKEHHGIVGYLAQPLYLRVQLESDGNCDQEVETISKEFFSAVLHMDFGTTFRKHRNLSAWTLFQWLPAAWRPTPRDSLDLGFKVAPFPFQGRIFNHEKFKLVIFVVETCDQLNISAAFRPDFFKRSTVEQLIGNIRDRLERFAVDE
jgi:hypothetical protein